MEECSEQSEHDFEEDKHHRHPAEEDVEMEHHEEPQSYEGEGELHEEKTEEEQPKARWRRRLELEDGSTQTSLNLQTHPVILNLGKRVAWYGSLRLFEGFRWLILSHIVSVVRCLILQLRVNDTALAVISSITTQVVLLSIAVVQLHLTHLSC